MANRPAFGRRINPEAQQVVAPRPGASVTQPTSVAVPTAVPSHPDEENLSVEEEVAAWKATRKGTFNIPWRQIYLMATLCFGIASFVLPDSVNDSVDWLLWGLAAMSGYAWYTTRRKKPAVTSPAAP